MLAMWIAFAVPADSHSRWSLGVRTQSHRVPLPGRLWVPPARDLWGKVLTRVRIAWSLLA